MLAWGFGFRMWRLTLARSDLFPVSADYSVVMCGAWPGTLVTWPWHHLSMTYCCAQRLWSLICVTCGSTTELLVPRFGRPVLLCQERLPQAQWTAAYKRDGYGGVPSKIECGWSKMLVFRVCGVRQNLCVQSLPQPWPRWPDFWLFTNIDGCCAGRGCACLFPVFW